MKKAIALLLFCLMSLGVLAADAPAPQASATRIVPVIVQLPLMRQKTLAGRMNSPKVFFYTLG